MQRNPEHLIGKNIKREYHISGLIGKGEYGLVFQATRRSNQEKIAVKVHCPTVSPDNGLEYAIQAMQFEREATITEFLKHEHIVPIKDRGIDKEKELLFYVMPVAQGSLRGHVPKGTQL